MIVDRQVAKFHILLHLVTSECTSELFIPHKIELKDFDKFTGLVYMVFPRSLKILKSRRGNIILRTVTLTYRRSGRITAKVSSPSVATQLLNDPLQPHQLTTCTLSTFAIAEYTLVLANYLRQSDSIQFKRLFLYTPCNHHIDSTLHPYANQNKSHRIIRTLACY